VSFIREREIPKVQREAIPRGLRARSFFGLVGTAEAVSFQNLDPAEFSAN
jgi:hypothetical protein